MNVTVLCNNVFLQRLYKSNHHHHHWLDSPVWTLVFFKSFFHSSLFNAKFFQFLSPNFRLNRPSCTPRHWVSLLVASYNTQGYGGVILLRPHTEINQTSNWLLVG
jgi:hypothetical protein